MPNLDIGKTQLSDQENRVETYEITPLNIDGVSGEETEWTNSKASVYWAYFNEISDLKSALILKSIWNTGKGYTTENNDTKITLDHINGWGKDTFADILFNMDLSARIFGDSFAEIIRSRDSRNELINLKPLDPSTIKIIVGKNGRIKRYEEFSKTTGKAVNVFSPDEILHFSNNRLANQIHGISDIESLEPIIKADQENFEDLKKIMHRQARPLIMFKLKTDNTGKISEFVSKMDKATNEGNNVYIPDDENTISYEVVQVSVADIIMAWRADLRNKFYRAVGLPQIVPGGGGQSSESESKVIYLAFEQIVERDQRYIEDQLWQQLQIKIDLYPPTTLSAQLQQDESKDANNALRFQPSDTQAGVGR